MALDGIAIAGLAEELRRTIQNTRITKIAQPENDELMLTCKGTQGQYRLSMSANASLPFVYLTDKNKPSPMQAPTFCMVLRKHLAGGRITAIDQPGMERILIFSIEHLDEMGDLCHKKLILELMGKHSNIIFCDETDRIIDSIKHISNATSSLREVLPGRDYVIPATQEEKKNPLALTDAAEIRDILRQKPTTLSKAIYGSFTGISPTTANEIAFRSGLDADAPVASVSEDQLLLLAGQFVLFMDQVRLGEFSPCIIRDGTKPVEFSAEMLTMYSDLELTSCKSMSRTVEEFYAQKAVYSRIRQKSSDLRHIVNTALDRNRKKYQLQLKQLKDTQKRDKYKVYGELINTYGYNVPQGARTLTAPNYYEDNREISIPLDPQLSPQENAQRYFDRYNKQKRTFEALSQLVEQTRGEIDHLESVQNAIDIALSPDDLAQIRDELVETGYIRKGHSSRKKRSVKSKPFHYRSPEGYDLYVGKNNYQNDELTFKVANSGDWWFHAKGIPGSHVIVKGNGTELPDAVFEEAARLAGFYSKGRDSEKLEIDYLQRKDVKKPNGAAPGYVIYYTNYSMTINPDISDLLLVEE